MKPTASDACEVGVNMAACASSDSDAADRREADPKAAALEELKARLAHESNSKTKLFELAVKTRMDEIQLFMSRSNYFVVFQTALVFGVFAGRISVPIVVTALASTGMIVSWLWLMAIFGGRFWHARWEKRVADLEIEIYGSQIQVFAATRERIFEDVKASIDWHGDHGWFRKAIVNNLILWKPSIANAMLWMSITMLVFWLIVLLHTLAFCGSLVCSVPLFSAR